MNNIYSRRIFGKTKMNYFQYIFVYCIPSGFQSIHRAFLNWMDLVWFEDNQKQYTLFPGDDPLEECRLYFWDELHEECYSKEFIEYLYELSDQVDKGQVKVIPFTKKMLDEIEDLLE